MEHSEEYFNAEDGTKLYYQIWKPTNTPKAIIQIVHGIVEHGARYLNVVNALVPAEYGVYVKDHRGHGKSGGLQGYINSFNDYISDEKEFTALIEKQEPGVPIFLLGHSLGAILAVLYAAEDETHLSGLVLSGLGFPATSDINPFLVLMSRILSKVWPRGRLKLELSEDISRDKSVVEAYFNDPYVFKNVSYRLGAETLRVGKIQPMEIAKITIPILGQSGEKDVIMLEADRLFDSVTATDKELKIYEGLYHEVYNELKADRDQVLADLVTWLDNHI